MTRTLNKFTRQNWDNPYWLSGYLINTPRAIDIRAVNRACLLKILRNIWGNFLSDFYRETIRFVAREKIRILGNGRAICTIYRPTVARLATDSYPPLKKRDHKVILEYTVIDRRGHFACDKIKICRIVVSGRHDRVRGVHKGALGDVARQPGRKASLWVLYLPRKTHQSTRIWESTLASNFVYPSTLDTSRTIAGNTPQIRLWFT